MKNKILILDIDGVLITTPNWKPDLINSDGYSDFNESCIKNLNKLLSIANFDIWLSSSRRAVKSILEFNLIFKNRGINGEIIGYVPNYTNCKSRKEEILRFISEFNISNFLIIDDDKSLNGLDVVMKKRLILTELTIGFSIDKLIEATEVIKNDNQNKL